MVDVAHSTLTGADLHEPKGVASAASGTVYISDGAGSGSWGTVASSLNFVGMVAPFITPAVQSGWLELDGTDKSRTTFSDLFTVMTIQQTGTRSSGSAIISGLSSTTNMKAGYYVGGTGITNGSLIVSVDSSTQITISNNASSSGSHTVIVSPWALGDGSTTFTLPDTRTSGAFIRSRTSSVHLGTTQSNQNKYHRHTTDSQGSHTHTVTIAAGQGSHSHTLLRSNFNNFLGGSSGVGNSGSTTASTDAATLPQMTGTADSQGAHTHTSSYDGDVSDTEARPNNISLIWCVKY